MVLGGESDCIDESVPCGNKNINCEKWVKDDSSFCNEPRYMALCPGSCGFPGCEEQFEAATESNSDCSLAKDPTCFDENFTCESCCTDGISNTSGYRGLSCWIDEVTPYNCCKSDAPVNTTKTFDSESNNELSNKDHCVYETHTFESGEQIQMPLVDYDNDGFGVTGDFKVGYFKFDYCWPTKEESNYYDEKTYYWKNAHKNCEDPNYYGLKPDEIRQCCKCIPDDW